MRPELKKEDTRLAIRAQSLNQNLAKKAEPLAPPRSLPSAEVQLIPIDLSQEEANSACSETLNKFLEHKSGANQSIKCALQSIISTPRHNRF